MGAATELRKQIESALAGRIPAALSPRPLRSPELIPCGVAEIDALLGGGWPLGSIVELTLPRRPTVRAGSSGRTTLALSTLAGLTRRGQCCAYVDASDALDPLSAAALGVELRRLLWIRPQEAKTKLRKPSADFYQRLDRALRATDLLLNAGGWGAVVLDIGELPAAQARRVPLATWYRFRLQAEKSRALLLLLTPVACANSCAAVSLHNEETQAEWQRAAENGLPLLAELRHRVHLSRSRAGVSIDQSSVPKKPPISYLPLANGGKMRGDEQTWWKSTLTWPG
jgi:hypothetical protein